MEALLSRKFLLAVFFELSLAAGSSGAPLPPESIVVQEAGNGTYCKEGHPLVYISFTSSSSVNESVHACRPTGTLEEKEFKPTTPSRLSTTLPEEATLAFTATSMRCWRDCGWHPSPSCPALSGSPPTWILITITNGSAKVTAAVCND